MLDLKSAAKHLAVAVLTLSFLNFGIASSSAQGAALSPIQAQKLAVDAYVYGYSLITSEVTRQAFIDTAAPDPATFQAPMGQLVKQPGYPPATYKGVTAPNADTLYSAGFFNVSKEPWVLSYPKMGSRYFLFPIYSEWTEVVASPGTRTVGGSARNILITGPGWNGAVPAGMTQVKMPTGYAFIIGRTYSTGTPADLAAVHQLQAHFKLVPLSSFGKPYTPNPGTTGGPFSVKEKVRDIIAAMNTSQYFNLMAKTMAISPPVLPQDSAVVAEMAKIGLVPGQPFDMSKLAPNVQAALENVGQLAFAQISPMQTKGGKTVNGWLLPGACGSYGTQYLIRAAVSAFGWGCNLHKDAIYPNTTVDSTGLKLTGTNTYVVHFAKGQSPPVSGFWSITMYDSSYFFYPNQLNKLTESMRNHPQINADGSLDLYFSHVKPAKIAQANWLPAPAGRFILMMRMYWPNETSPSILNGSWSPPPVRMSR